MDITDTHPAVPMILNDESGVTMFRLNRDGSVETDWKRIEAKAAEWTPDETSQAVIICKVLVEVAERVRAETEARFVPRSS